MINENSKNFLNTRFQFHCRIFIKLIEITQWNGKLVFKKLFFLSCNLNLRLLVFFLFRLQFPCWVKASFLVHNYTVISDNISFWFYLSLWNLRVIILLSVLLGTVFISVSDFKTSNTIIFFLPGNTEYKWKPNKSIVFIQMKLFITVKYFLPRPLDKV